MGPALFSASTIPVLEQVVNYSQARHNVLAGNIANLDTPGYQVRDLSPELFQSKLKRALSERDSVSVGAGGNLSGRGQLDEVSRHLQSILRHDENNTSLEKQVTEMAKNQMQHNLALSIMNSQFRLIQAAISERA